MVIFFLIYSLLSSQSVNAYKSGQSVLVQTIAVVGDTPKGTLILDLFKTLNMRIFSIKDNSSISFRFFSENSTESNYFIIDQLSGQLKTKNRLNCENMHYKSHKNCTISVEIIAYNSKVNEENRISLNIMIEGKNDLPYFSPSNITIFLNENESSNLEKPIAPPINGDFKPNEIKYIFSLLNVTLKNADLYGSQFEILQIEKINTQVKLSTATPTKLGIVFLAPFDAESIKEFCFYIIATDNKNRTLDKCLITVKIHDINDNSPIFDRSEYELTIDESLALPKTPLIQVHAKDIDDGINGAVKYSLVDRSLIDIVGVGEFLNLEYGKTQVREFFKIDTKTGLVSVGDNFSLDYEIMSTYRLTVEAKDNGKSAVYANVIIYLNDVNDNTPEVNITFSNQLAGIKDTSQGKKINISELMLPNINMAEISIRDKDTGANGLIKVDFKQFKVKTFNKSQNLIEDSNDFGLILSDSNKNIYTIIIKQKLDRESFDK